MKKQDELDEDDFDGTDPDEEIDDIEFNFLKEPFWFLSGKLGKLYNHGRDSVIDLQYFAAIMIGLSLAVFALGLALGGIADWTESEGLVSFASGVVYTGLTIGSVAVFAIWMKVAIAVLKAYYLAKFGNAINSKIPALKKTEEADAFSAWVRTIAAWVGFGYLGAWIMQSYSPIWRHMFVFIAMAVIVIGLVETNGWFKVTLGRPVVFGIQAAALFACLVWYFVPVVHDPVGQVARRYLGNGDYEMAKAKIERNRKDVLRERYSMLADVLKDIESHMAECGGRICDNDRTRYSEVQVEMASLDDGTYMEKFAMPEEAKPKAEPKTVTPVKLQVGPKPDEPKPDVAEKKIDVQQVGSNPGKAKVAYRVPARNDPVWKLLD